MVDPIEMPGLRTWHEICAVNWPGRGRLPSRIAYGGGSDVLSGRGNPNLVRRARFGSLYIQRDGSLANAMWRNVDGAFLWCPYPVSCPP